MAITVRVERVKTGPSPRFLYFRVIAEDIDEQGRVCRRCNTPVRAAETLSVPLPDVPQVAQRIADARARVALRCEQMRAALCALEDMDLPEVER